MLSFGGVADPLSLQEHALRLLAALASGALLGLERERHKGTGPSRAAAGLRTFALVSLLGGIAGALDSAALIAVGGAFVGGAALASYLRSDRTDPGLTSETALLLAYFLGVCAMRAPGIAIATAITATALLAFRGRLHALARTALSDEEILDALVLAIAAVVILPVLPNRGMGPFDAVNPARVWRLAVLVMAIGFASHVAVRLLGAHVGVPLAGFAGGFLSSTATLGSMSALARGNAQAVPAATAAAVLANVSSLAQVAIVVGVTSPALLLALRWPLLAGAAGATLCGIVFTLRRKEAAAAQAFESKSVDLLSALAFAGGLALVMLAVAALQHFFGRAGFLVGAVAAGAGDVHAASITVADAVARQAVPLGVATWTVLAAISANTLVKAVIAVAGGPAAFAWRVTTGLAALLVPAWAVQLAGHAR